MAASATDKARKSYSYLQKTLNGGISDVATFLTPNNVNNIPTDTGVSFVVDRVDSSGNKTPTLRELMSGVVSAGNIVNLVRGQQGTTQQAHLNNAVIEFVNSGAMWNDLIDFLLQDHDNPNGGHKNLTDLSGNEWLERGSVASAVNQVKVSNAATGNPVRADASGDDTNSDFYIGGKGTGLAHAENPEIVRDFVASGGVIALSAGLIGTFSNIVYYINSKRYKKSSVANKTYTASKDTYVDIDTTGAVTYTEVTSGATPPSLAANSIRLAMVVTNGTTIAAVNQAGRTNTVQTYPTAPLRPFDWYEELGRSTLTAVGDLVTVSFVPKKYLKIICRAVNSGALACGVRFNNDSGNNYAHRIASNGSADSTFPSTSSLYGDAGAYNLVIQYEVTNNQYSEKSAYGYTLAENAVGAANMPGRTTIGGKWSNIVDKISRVDVYNVGAGDFAAGTELIVLGHD